MKEEVEEKKSAITKNQYLFVFYSKNNYNIVMYRVRKLQNRYYY